MGARGGWVSKSKQWEGGESNAPLLQVKKGEMKNALKSPSKRCTRGVGGFTHPKSGGKLRVAAQGQKEKNGPPKRAKMARQRKNGVHGALGGKKGQKKPGVPKQAGKDEKWNWVPKGQKVNWVEKKPGARKKQLHRG